MAERLTDKQVTDLLDILRSNAALDHKVTAVTNAKSAIKQHNVPEGSIALLFEALRTASTAQHAVLVNAGFTALGHLLTRLSRQEPKHIGKEAVRTLPVVIEKLGDQKDKYRTLASQALVTIYAVNPGEVERMVRTTAMSGKNPRAKEASLHWLLLMHQDHGLQFRSYVPLLMELLEDADGMVRDAAKHTVIELFRNAPNTAKSDLKRQLKNYKVRPAIEQAIIKELAPAGARSETPSAPAPSSRPHFAGSVSSMSSERPVTPAVPESQADPVEPQYVNTNRELDEVIKGMAWQYEGRETEQNWQKREQGMTTLRRLNAGNAPSDFHDTFVNGLRGMLDGIIKSLTSLRTSLSKEACALIEDVALTLGPAMEPMVELLMQTLLKMTASTKKITSQMTSTTIDTIISRISYTPRIMQHIWSACQDKNVQPRLYTTIWLKTLIKKTSGNKHHIEHTGGVDLIEKCLKKGLADANPGVREKMRPTFWAFWAVWPSRADAIMEDLDATAQKLLNKDPSNPNSPKKTEPARPGSSLSRTGKTASRPNIREAMMAQKRAMAAQKLPPRPGSAMAQLSPVRATSNASTNAPQSGHAAPPKLTSRTKTESTISVNAGGMSVAPMRPSRRRPEITRPATAGPYSVRDQPGLEIHSPESLKSRSQTPRVMKDTTPKKSVSRTRPGHVSHGSESSIPSPTSRTGAKLRVVSPRVSPAKPRMPHEDLLGSSPTRHGPGKQSVERYSPTKVHEDISLVVPSMASLESASTIVADDEEFATMDVPTTPTPVMAHIARHSEPPQDAEPLKVYEDPDAEIQATPKPEVSGPVLEDRPVNEDAAKLQKAAEITAAPVEPESPEKMRQNSRLLDSGIAKIKAMSLEVHGFRKLQSLIRDSRTMFTDDKFEALLLGLFKYLENPLSNLPSDKGQDIKAQILATIKLLLRKERENFQPHVSKGLEALLQTRSAYDSRAHVVSGLELLADELVGIGDGSEIVVVLTRQLHDITDATTEGCRSLSMGLHVLKEMLNRRAEFQPTSGELEQLTGLAGHCLESANSGVRMDAVKFCVALHARVGEATFWDALSGIKDDPKSLITYYIVKRQREQQQQA
ncbi:HEAT repeat containing protein [Cordyceps fumosorosea ARSEF 2679]|uniref:HEAT repeat containing protein n=1 Tax=Cordyceps fumosorosea (strain ARSEF 2679) TaxID=1081104 RepID=A0A167M3V1_CORFA|nr:HEAT repeat containing protein [Cordyceps fumosorosea ARSEF 2679]OAA53889.1 HEAT repeat containing protein [Cordyceps fumosorosea ARSEF 2679]